MDHPMKHGRVLLADGHVGMLQGVHSLLETMFDTVVMVADEKSLFDAVTILRPDLVVVDMSLPGCAESNIARRLVERYPALRLIILSVHDEPSVASQIRNAGAAGFVLKRAAATDLVPAVREVLGGGVYVSPAVNCDSLHQESQQVGG
jgi:DNA-binding NarL/FixJ family response regulator